MSETEKLSKMRRQKNLFEIKEQGKNLGGGTLNLCLINYVTEI